VDREHVPEKLVVRNEFGQQLARDKFAKTPQLVEVLPQAILKILIQACCVHAISFGLMSGVVHRKLFGRGSSHAHFLL
jgi:hypothetical protein